VARTKEKPEERENPIVDILTAEHVEPDWLIEDLFLQGGMYCLVGESGAGKSNICYTLALAVASGCSAFGGIVPKGPPRRVVYFDDENSEQDRNQYLRRAWKGLTVSNRGKEPDLGLLMKNFWPVGFGLGEEWEEKAQGWVDFLQPHMIVVDTANASFAIEDENNNAEAGKAIRNLKKVMRTTEPVASSLVIKHAKTRTEKGQIRTVRGAKVWKDQSDGMLFQVKAGGRPRKDGLSLTRLIPDKVRAYGLQRPIYITPRWTDDRHSGLVLDGSYSSSKEHKRAETKDEGDEDDEF
jgi:hypothetical protein